MSEFNTIEEQDPDLSKLETQLAAKAKTKETEEDFQDTSESALESLEQATEMLKNCAILFEFLGGDFCKAITKREREIIARHVEKIYTLTDELDETIEELNDLEDEGDA